jgi:acetylornithine deacetylase
MTTLGTVEILERLVGFPTVSRDSNLPLIEWVRNYLADHGIDSHLVPNATGGKANLFASIGPQEEGGLVLSGHTDVVPIDGQPWSSDPFKLTSRDARLHARGACDMKGFIAAALARVPRLEPAKLKRPVHFMFSYDEEIGCLGAPSMIAAASRRLPKPAVVIVGEPTSMAVANSHKGICAGRTRITGIEAHSSLTHQGVSAVMLAAELIHHLNETAAKLASGPANARSSRFVPPYSTVTANMIQGGTASNIMAGACEFAWDIRAVPGESAHAVIDSLKAVAATLLARLEREGRPCSITSELLADVPPLVADGGIAETLARALSPVTGESITVPFATEGGQFQKAGWSTVVCGPGSIERAHKADEYVEREQLSACETFLDRAIARQCMS